jgi:GT2 family glycosyltransferase
MAGEPEPPRVSVIVTTWNAAAVLPRCLDSLAIQAVPGGVETIVVDSASADGTAELLAGRTEAMRVILSEQNLGYAGGNNVGAREARGSVLVFLNPDTELLGTDVLARLAAAVEHPGVGIAGPMLVNPDGSLQPSCAAFPGIGRALLVSSGAHLLLPEALEARVNPERWSHDRARAVDWVKGAALAVRAELFRELGGFWRTAYGEEEDLALRARRRGAGVRFEPSARVLHIGSFSLGQRWNEHQRAARVAGAELTILRTHYPRSGLVIRIISGIGFGLRACFHAALGRRQRAEVFLALAKVYAGGATGETW